MAKTLEGVVVVAKSQKTLIVQVERKFRHAKYLKVITRHKKYHVHNELENIAAGDLVQMKEVKPRSKTKYFEVVKKITKK